VSSFFKSDSKPAATPAAAEPAPARSVDRVAEQPSVLGRGMQITGNIVSTGSVQIHGRVVGDIQAAQLIVCEGARVEGKVIAQDTVIQGTFNGNIHSTTVKLQKTAKVDGEIFSR
jgi:cytoskeletal protein CcmA (bactofilin family)